MKSLVFYLVGLALSWHFSDLSSDSLLQSVLAPIAIILFFIAIAVWFVLNTLWGSSIGGDGGYGDGSFDDFGSD